jgi:hypothetical protein
MALQKKIFQMLINPILCKLQLDQPFSLAWVIIRIYVRATLTGCATFTVLHLYLLPAAAHSTMRKSVMARR